MNNHKKNTYAAVKGAQQQGFRQVDICVNDSGIWVPSHDSPNTGEVYVDKPNRFLLASPLHLDNIVAQVVDICDHYLVVQLPEDQHISHQNMDIVQKQTIRHADTIFEHLSGHWEQFWQRLPGPSIENLDEDTMLREIQRCLPSISPMSEVVGETLQEWKIALSHCKTNSAPGLDGFNIQELRMLPDAITLQAIDIIANFRSFPADCMIAKTVPFPKKGTFTPECSRPITILATLYRIWAKTCCSKISQHFVSFMPPRANRHASRKRGLRSKLHDAGNPRNGSKKKRTYCWYYS